MLDWLSSHQVTSATEGQQIPDAPETPAPIFAYRALKGILFGSPDYDADEEEDNKENIAPVVPDLKVEGPSPRPQPARRAVQVDSSPLPSKSTQQSPQHGRFRVEQQPVSPSPHRRRPPVSPTKSILRTPGLPTPRRQNVNVTFKDIRASVSPIAVTTKLLAARNEAKLAIVHGRETTIQKPSNQQTAVAPQEDAKAAPCEVEVEVVPTAYDMSAVDAYLKSTEREMRKLVMYSQRMKEYARVSQQENAALRRERDDLKREVEELRKVGMKTGRISVEDAAKKDLELGFGIARTRRGADNVGGKDLRSAGSQAERLNKARAVQGACLPESTASAGHAKRHESTAQTENEPFGQKEAVDTPAQDSQQRVGSKKRAATSAQLAPDRLAAAKERLRVKSEERRRALSAAVGQDSDCR